MSEKFRLVEAEKAFKTPVKVSCELLGVSRSGFYGWERRAPCQRELEDAWITERIKEIHRENRGVYGAPRIHAELRMVHGVKVGKKRVARLMRQAEISGLVKKRRGNTTIRVPGVRVADDLLLRDFTATEPNTKWVADITYLKTWQGWVYLAAVQDLYSRRIVGWSMADQAKTTGPRPDSPLRSRIAIRVAGLRPGSTDQRHREVDGQSWHRLRQLRCRDLFRDTEEGVDLPAKVAGKAGDEDRGFRIHRRLLQPKATPLKARLGFTCRVRGGGMPPPRESSRAKFTLKDNP